MHKFFIRKYVMDGEANLSVFVVLLIGPDKKRLSGTTMRVHSHYFCRGVHPRHNPDVNFKKKDEGEKQVHTILHKGLVTLY